VLPTEAALKGGMYSVLSITTTLEPLSGLVITMSSRFFKPFRVLTRVLGGWGDWGWYAEYAERRVELAGSSLSFSSNNGSIFQYVLSKLA